MKGFGQKNPRILIMVTIFSGGNYKRFFFLLKVFSTFFTFSLMSVHYFYVSKKATEQIMIELPESLKLCCHKMLSDF